MGQVNTAARSLACGLADAWWGTLLQTALGRRSRGLGRGSFRSERVDQQGILAVGLKGPPFINFGLDWPDSPCRAAFRSRRPCDLACTNYGRTDDRSSSTARENRTGARTTGIKYVQTMRIRPGVSGRGRCRDLEFRLPSRVTPDPLALWQLHRRDARKSADTLQAGRARPFTAATISCGLLLEANETELPDMLARWRERWEGMPRMVRKQTRIRSAAHWIARRSAAK